MFSTLKHLMPLPLRTRLKWLGYALQDIIDPIQAPYVPPRRKTFIGVGNFVDVGDHFFGTLKHYGWQKNMDILEVGCGQGRMARPMIESLTGQYHGFDIDKSGIEWCQEQYKHIENYHFTHADIFNARYNRAGAFKAGEFIFPYQDNRFDCVYLTSVFTHMFTADIEAYMKQIQRVLKPGGLVLISWYLWEANLINPKMDFKFTVDDVSYTTLKQNPEAALAYDMDWVKALYAKYDLEIEEIERGVWAGGSGQMGLQDLIVARYDASHG